jgi:phenylpyruvate tautomerase PptA (4-oxalocrotonate tautomerase family)
MPMLDVHIPEGALKPESEAALITTLTDILIRYEGFDPANPIARAASWTFLHRPALFVGGETPDAPRYKIVATVPEGQLDRAARDSVVAEVTAAVLDAEENAWPRDEGRVWVFPTEIPDGYWGGQGRITPLAGILEILTDADATEAATLADKRIAASRAERSTY